MKEPDARRSRLDDEPADECVLSLCGCFKEGADGRPLTVYRREEGVVGLLPELLDDEELMKAGLLQLFAFKKFGTIMLCSLTPSSVMELQLHPEECVVECMRSAEVARVVWRRTVGTTATFSLTQLYPNYQQWACSEKLVDNDTNTPVTDLKNVHDPQRAQARALASSASFRRGSVMRRPTTGRARSVPGSASLEEAKGRLRIILSQQEEHIRRLQHRLREAEQQVTNMYGL
jgi:hypothetical protein